MLAFARPVPNAQAYFTIVFSTASEVYSTGPRMKERGGTIIKNELGRNEKVGAVTVARMTEAGMTKCQCYKTFVSFVSQASL